MRGPTRPHKGVEVKKKNFYESILYSLDRPAGEISHPVVFWRLRRARRADYGAMPPARRCDVAAEARTSANDAAAIAPRGMPTPSSAARPACWSYLMTAY